MKVVKKSISLPEDLFKHAEKRSKALAKERGGNENVSAYVRELIAADKRNSEKALAA